MQLILGSSSPFRKMVLEKLRLPFRTESPDIDESPLPDESVQEMVLRLAINKAEKIAQTNPDAVIISADQVATVENQVLGKPHNHENAVKQLQLCSGKVVTFYSGLCVLNSATKNQQTDLLSFEVYFKTLSAKTIEQYLRKDQPYNSAGSFKSEGLGIILFEKLIGDDPNTLIGLPLIRVTEMLANEGINPLEYKG